MADPGGSFDDDESTVMMPTFSQGSFFADRYRVSKLLGTGAMGRVYAATELHSQRQVAIKVLHKERLGEEDTVARFQREAEVLASIGHPCIVEIYAFHHTADGTPYLAMELLEGVTLKTRLKNAGHFQDPKEFQPILDGVCGALDAAHKRGIIHRDMKPENIFLPATGEPRAKLVDFGLSRIAKPDKSLTHSGMILGTPRYMAPEQIRDASSAGPAGDIYALAVIVHEALAGESPYPAQDYGQLLGCVLETRTTPLSEARPDLPPMLTDVIRRAMNADPAQRFQTCGAFAAAFGHAIGSGSQADAAAARISTERKRMPSLSSIAMNKGSTLAFDVSAMGLPNLDYANSPAPVHPSASAPATQPSAPAGLGNPAELWNETAEPTTPDHPPGGRGPGASGERPVSSPAAQFGVPVTPAPIAAAPVRGATASGGYTPAPIAPQQTSPAPMSNPVNSPGQHPSNYPGHPPAQGGDTLYLGNVGGDLVPPEPVAHQAAPQPAHGHRRQPTPRPSSRPAAFASSQPAPGRPTAPKKKSKKGIILFFLAMIIVIVVSAAGGLALRAHMRGELELPFEIPGLTPAVERTEGDADGDASEAGTSAADTDS